MHRWPADNRIRCSGSGHRALHCAARHCGQCSGGRCSGGRLSHAAAGRTRMPAKDHHSSILGSLSPFSRLAHSTTWHQILSTPRRRSYKRPRYPFAMSAMSAMNIFTGCARPPCLSAASHGLNPETTWAHDSGARAKRARDSEAKEASLEEEPPRPTKRVCVASDDE